MRCIPHLTTLAVLLAPIQPVAAQPTPAGAPTSTAQTRAEALMAAGKARVAAKDFAGALALFSDAYREFPDPKYFIAIGVALERLGRDLEAADYYQRYLDSPELDPVRAVEVRKGLASVDARLGRLQIVVLGPPSSEVQIGDQPWGAPVAAPVRVQPGAYRVRARFPGRTVVETAGSVPAGDTVEVRLDLTLVRRPPAIPAPAPPPPLPAVSPEIEPAAAPPAPVRVAVTPPPGPPVAPAVAVSRPGPTPRRPSSLSVFAGAIGAVADPGVRGLLGLGYEPDRRIRLGLDIILGPGPGVAPRGTLYLTGGRLRPTMSIGVPVRRLERLDNPMSRPCSLAVVDPDASRSPSIELAIHGGVGLEWRASQRLALTAELGYERYLGIDSCLNVAGVVTPMAGLVGRL